MIYLVRFEMDIHGTKGMLFLPDGWSCCTMEPPFIGNQPDRSSIPSGKYAMVPRNTNNHGYCYELQDVPGRSAILFHTGNYAGDEESGLKADTDGCILLGNRHGELMDQKVVLDSRTTVAEFMLRMKDQPASLWIKGVQVNLWS